MFSMGHLWSFDVWSVYRRCAFVHVTSGLITERDQLKSRWLENPSRRYGRYIISWKLPPNPATKWIVPFFQSRTYVFF